MTATAYDTFSNVKTDYDGTGAVLTSTLGTSPAPSSTAPTVPSNLTWSSGTGIGSATITATRATKTDTDSGVTEYLTITSSIADRSRTATTANFAVTPNAVTTLTFSGQPIDTQVNTGLVPSPIYSVCAPATTTPCALSTAAIPSSPVAVYAVDAFSNPVLSQNIGITGSWLDAAVTRTTSGGTAAFGDSLKESTTGVGRALLATAALNGAVQKTSDKFRVVTTLKGCTGATCINKALGSTNSRTYVNSWSQITTSGCFFCAGVNVLQSTQLTLTSAASQCGNSVWISDISDQRVTGTNPQVTSSGRELIVVPKATLKSSGVLNRGVPSFNICFGAIWIGPGAPTQGWLGKKAATNNTPTRATEVQDGTVVPQGERWYGIPANCGTAGLSADDPCILLRTKQKADVLNLLGSDAASIMTDADLAIVVRVGGSWDGGSHPF